MTCNWLLTRRRLLHASAIFCIYSFHPPLALTRILITRSAAAVADMGKPGRGLQPTAERGRKLLGISLPSNVFALLNAFCRLGENFSVVFRSRQTAPNHLEKRGAARRETQQLPTEKESC